jgi:hypothetical protein
LATAGEEPIIVLWSIPHKNKIKILEGHSGEILSINFAYGKFIINFVIRLKILRNFIKKIFLIILFIKGKYFFFLYFQFFNFLFAIE